MEELDNERPPLFTRIVTISYRCIVIMLLWFPLFLTCFPLYLLGLSIWGRPPIISPWSRFVKYFIASFTAGRSDENIPFTNRVSVFLIVFSTLLKVPVNGICWFIDELLFSKYHEVTIKEPVFFISGTRTGSTQLAHYLEDDKINFIAPTLEEILFPFIWFWKFVVPVLKVARKFNTRKKVKADENFTSPVKEIFKRNDFDMSKTPTFEVSVGVWHFRTQSIYLGVDFMKWGFAAVNLIDKPTDKQLHSSILQLCDSTLKKVIYFRGSSMQRVLVKGHFLILANQLTQHYKGAKFFTVVRDPLTRFRSSINFLKVVNKEDCTNSGFALCPTTWKVIRDYVVDVQTIYCLEEKLFYEEKSQHNKLVIPFNKFVNNLSATLESIYSFCNIPIPSHVLTNAVKIQKTTHNREKRRASYDPKYNRTLSSLGVDEEKLRDQLSDYYQWIKQFEET